MSGTLTLENIIQIYIQLEENYLRLPLSITQVPERDVDRLAEFLGGYSQQTYEIHYIDFYDESGANPILTSLSPTQRDVYSFCQILGRANTSKNSFDKVQRLVRIFINAHLIEGQTRLVNDCWNRFCQIKEVCQAILFEELNAENPNLYPATAEYSEVVKLFSDINNKPFSLADFGNPEYPRTLAIENAAELLATMLMVPIERLQDSRHEILNRFGETVLRSYNYFDIANYFKLPRRYIEVLVTWDHLDDFMSSLQVARDGYARG